MSKKITRIIAWGSLILVFLLALITAGHCFSTELIPFEDLAEDSQLDCSLAKITFLERSITLIYCDGSEEMIPNHHVPREILKKKLTLDGTVVRVEKFYFDIAGNPDLIYMLEGTVSRWKYAFSAKSYFY